MNSNTTSASGRTIERPTRRRATALFGAALASAVWPTHAQARYPTKPIRLIVPFASGGTTTILARLLGERMGQSLGQPVIVDNHPGAGGNIGMDLVAKAEPDGHTILLATVGLATNPSLYPKMAFDPLKDLAPIGLYCGVPNMLVVNPSISANNVRELIAYAKANPGKLAYGSNGNGSSTHLATEMLKASAGVDIVHVPYKGGAPAMQDLIGGQISMLFDQIPAVLPQVKGGRVRALAVSTLKRSPAAPDIPAISETIPGFDVTVWFGLLAPRGTPADVVARLNAEMLRPLKDAAFQAQLTGMGVTAMGGTPDEFTAFLRSETQRWAKVIKDSGARLD